MEDIPTLSPVETSRRSDGSHDAPPLHNLGPHSVPRSNVPAFFVLKDHSLNSRGRNQSQFSLAGIALGCYERRTHNTAVIGIIDLTGAKGLTSLRKKKKKKFRTLE